MAGDLGAALEIDQVELLAQRDVIERLEIELRLRGLAAANFEVRLIVGAQRSVGMRHVGDRALDGVHLGQHRVEFGLRRRGLLAELPAFILAGFAFGGVFGLADRLRDLVGLLVQLVDFGLLVAALRVQGDELVDIGREPRGARSSGGRDRRFRR